MLPASTSGQTAGGLPPFQADRLTHGDAGQELCPTCHNPAAGGWFRRDVPVSHPDFGKLLRCPDSFHGEVRAQRLQQVSQLGPEDVKRRLTDIRRNQGNAAMLDAAQELISRGYGWLYIWGGPGNAKSEVLKAIVNQLNEAGRAPAIYSTLGNILDYIRQTFSKNGSVISEDFLTRFERLKNAPVLAIDEMDKPNESDWMMDFRFHFLDARYMSAINRQTVTVFAGNKNPVGMGDVLYDRISDGRFAVTYNGSPSARRGMSW